MTLAEIEDLIIELLAADAGRSSRELRAELEKLGELLPIDSLLAAEVLTRVQTAVGVTLPATAETALALRSVRSFASAVRGLLAEDSLSKRASA